MKTAHIVCALHFVDGLGSALTDSEIALVTASISDVRADLAIYLSGSEGPLDFHRQWLFPAIADSSLWLHLVDISMVLRSNMADEVQQVLSYAVRVPVGRLLNAIRGYATRRSPTSLLLLAPPSSEPTLSPTSDDAQRRPRPRHTLPEPLGASQQYKGSPLHQDSPIALSPRIHSFCLSP